MEYQPQIVMAVDGSWVSHKSLHRATSMIPEDAFKSDAEYINAIKEKSLELALQTLSLAVSDFNVVSMLVSMDVNTPDIGMYNCAKSPSDPGWKTDLVIDIKRTLTNYLPMIGVATVGVVGVEADTVGYFISQCDKSYHERIFRVKLEDDYELYLLTADFDWEVSINGKASLYNPMTKKFTTSQDMIDYFGTESYRLAHISHRCLTSNKDGIIGVKGIGGKSSARIRDYFYNAATNSFQKPEIEDVDSKDRKLVQKVLDDWEHFTSNWRLVDEDWIYETQISEDNENTVDAIIYAMCLAASNKADTEYSLFYWLRVAKIAGKDAKLGRAKARFETYQAKKAGASYG